MSLRQLMGGSFAVMFGAGAMLASVATSQAAMSPAPLYVAPAVQHVDCAVGAHIGPLGGCVIGDDHRPDVVEHRSADVPDRDKDGCETKTVKKSDDMGNSETKSKTKC